MDPTDHRLCISPKYGPMEFGRTPLRYLDPAFTLGNSILYADLPLFLLPIEVEPRLLLATTTRAIPSVVWRSLTSRRCAEAQ